MKIFIKSISCFLLSLKIKAHTKKVFFFHNGDHEYKHFPLHINFKALYVNHLNYCQIYFY